MLVQGKGKTTNIRKRLTAKPKASKENKRTGDGSCFSIYITKPHHTTAERRGQPPPPPLGLAAAEWFQKTENQGETF